MFELQALLRRFGYASEVFAEHIPTGLQDRVRSIHDYGGSRSELLLVHHSIGYDAFDDVVDLPNDLVVVYHNVTPERYFEDQGVQRLHPSGPRAAGTARSARAVRRRRLQLQPARRCSRPGSAGSRCSRSGWTSASSPHGTGPTGRPALLRRLAVRRTVGRQQVPARAGHRVRRSTCGTSTSTPASCWSVTCPSDDYVAEVRRTAADARRRRSGSCCSARSSDGRPACGVRRSGRLRLLERARGIRGSDPRGDGRRGPGGRLRCRGRSRDDGRRRCVAPDQGARELVAATVHAVQSDPGIAASPARAPVRRASTRSGPSTPTARAAVVDRAAGYRPPLEIQVQGPFETSYSLAIMNRRLAEGLDEPPEQAVSMYATEGPGDYRPKDEDLSAHPVAARLFERSKEVPFPDVVIRQMFPPRVIDTPGGITCEYFGWEESRIPESMVRGLQPVPRRRGGDVERSSETSCATRESTSRSGWSATGSTRPIRRPRSRRPSSRTCRGFTFLHISSAFPRKGVDVLLEAYFAAFDGRERRDPDPEDLPESAQPGRGAARAAPVEPPESARRPLDRPRSRRGRDRAVSTTWPTATCIRHAARDSACPSPRRWPPVSR